MAENDDSWGKMTPFAANKLMMRGAEVTRRLSVSPFAVSKSVARGRVDNLVKEIQKTCFAPSRGHPEFSRDPETVSLSLFCMNESRSGQLPAPISAISSKAAAIAASRPFWP